MTCFRGFEALEYDDIVLVNAPFTKEIRDLNYVKQLSNSLNKNALIKRILFFN